MQSQNCRLFRRKNGNYKPFNKPSTRVILSYCNIKSSTICTETNFQICIRKDYR